MPPLSNALTHLTYFSFPQVVAGVGNVLLTGELSHRNHQLLLDKVIRAKHLVEANYIGSL